MAACGGARVGTHDHTTIEFNGHDCPRLGYGAALQASSSKQLPQHRKSNGANSATRATDSLPCVLSPHHAHLTSHCFHASRVSFPWRQLAQGPSHHRHGKGILPAKHGLTYLHGGSNSSHPLGSYGSHDQKTATPQRGGPSALAQTCREELPTQTAAASFL